MRMMRFPGLLAYAAMAMWLLHVMVTPAAAQPSAALVQSRLADHIDQFHAALMEKGASPDAHLTLASPNAAVALADGASLALESTTFNLATGRFLIRARGAEGSPLIAVVGVAATPVTVPVLARTIERNEMIGEEDIDWVEMTDARPGQFVEDASVLIGKVARRPLPAGQPLRKADVQSPVLIKRGETATIVLEGRGLRLTQSAIALASGGAGDVIAFRNLNSDREIKAVVVSKAIAQAPFRTNQTIASLEP